jgi:glyoxylase-like metal-dependent hydrolase (beta-lactamase superfamily II)
MDGGEATRLPDAAGYELWLLCVGRMDFAPGQALADRAVSICVNALLLRGHGLTVLVDAGSGPADSIHPGAALLDEALESADVTSDEIDAVVLTHLDFDHAGGVLAGTWPDEVRGAFPRVVISSVDFGQRRPAEPDDWDTGTRVIRAYGQDGRLEQAASGVEFMPGLRLVSAPGHRPGHCVLLVGDELVHAADLLHHEEHVEAPEHDNWSDADPEVALRTRLAWLERLARDETPVVFSHFSGRGRILPAYQWAADR